MLISQFSIVLCYQPEFYSKTLENLADTMLLQVEDQAMKKVCIEIVNCLYAIDYKLLDVNIQKLNLTRKTPLRKVVIEFENSSKSGKNVMF